MASVLDSVLTLQPVQPMSYRRSLFAIPEVQGPYAGFCADSSWNGWAVPCFTYDNCLLIGKDYEASAAEWGGDMTGASLNYDPDSDAFNLYDPISDASSHHPSFLIEVEGIASKVYAIGARFWTWEEVSV